MCLQLMVQLQSDPSSMPVENPTVEWGEALSPFQPIAIMKVPQQDINDGENVAICETLRLNPWGNLPTHRPLGGISRAQHAMFQALN